jgi:hypothetical protein
MKKIDMSSAAFAEITDQVTGEKILIHREAIISLGIDAADLTIKVNLSDHDTVFLYMKNFVPDTGQPDWANSLSTNAQNFAVFKAFIVNGLDPFNIVYETPLPQAITDLLSIMTVTAGGDDSGLAITSGQFSVGVPGNGRESVFGGGDSYPVPIAYHFDYSNLSGTTITGATDISEELQSDSGGSTVGLFDGTTAGKAILVGSDVTFGGVKAKITTAGDIGLPDNILAQYMLNDTTWVSAQFMVTDSSEPYEQRARMLATKDNSSEQWRFGFNPEYIYSDVWQKVTLTINGSAITKYWALFRITSDITTDPVIEQLKLHTNRFEINADGFTEYFGRARYPRTLVHGINNVVTNASANPPNETVVYGDGVSALYSDNELANSAIDGFLIIQNIEEGMDTSIPLYLDVSWYVKGTNTGDVSLHANIFDVKDGFVYDGTATPRESDEVITTIASDSNLVRKTTRLELPVHDLTPRDGAIVIDIHRDATGDNPNDTLSANIVVTNVKLTGYFWKP